MKTAAHLEETKWKPGQSGNALGRPLGGRSRALRALDDMLNEEGNAKLLRDTLQYEFKKDPYKFFRVIIMPLLPREAQAERQAQRLILSFATVPPKEKVIDVEDETNKGE